MNFHRMDEIVGRARNEWSEKDEIWAFVHNLGPELKAKIKDSIRDFLSHPNNIVKASGADHEDPSMRIAISQILLDLTREYDLRQ